VLSTVIGFIFGFIAAKLTVFTFKNVNRIKSERFFSGAQVAGGAAMAFMHGAQDGQKFMGVILLSILLVNGQSAENVSVEMPIWLMALCSIVMGLGTSIGGKKIIKSVGMDMVKLEKYQGFSADIAASISLLISSVFGIPVSTTHAKTTSIMGVGAVRRISAINFSVVKEMAVTWILTFPGCGLIGFIMTKIFMAIF
jgi:PiT family inorganic phosphate transporter